MATNTKAGRAVSAEVRHVTPAQAREMLENNHVNRRLRQKVVMAYRRDMEAGRWEFTGESVQVSRTGALLNGQHRLNALADAKVKSIDLLVVTGLPDDAQTLMDQGVGRRITDALLLQHGHVKNVTVVAGIARWLVLAPEVGPHVNPSMIRNKVTAAEAVEVFNRDPETIISAGQHAQVMRRHLLGSPTAMGYSWYQFHRVDPSACEEFFAGMRDMEWSFPNDPRKAALRRMQMIHADEGIKANQETGIILVSILTRAWNHWRKGEEVDTLGIRTKTGIILPVTPI